MENILRFVSYMASCCFNLKAYIPERMIIPEPTRVVNAGMSLKNIHPNATAHTILTYENGCKRLAGAILSALIKVE